MTDDKLHLIFHELINTVNGLNTMRQLCVKYIRTFKMERLEGRFKDEIVASYGEIDKFYKDIYKKVELLEGAVLEAGCVEIASGLCSSSRKALEVIGQKEAAAQIAFGRLSASDTKENLHLFAAALEDFKPSSDALTTTIKETKERLKAAGKY